MSVPCVVLMGWFWSLSLLQNYNWLILQFPLRGTSSSKILKHFLLQFSEIVSWDWKKIWLPWILAATNCVAHQGPGSLAACLKFPFCSHLHSKACEACSMEARDFHAIWFHRFLVTYFNFGNKISIILQENKRDLAHHLHLVFVKTDTTGFQTRLY